MFGKKQEKLVWMMQAAAKVGGDIQVVPAGVMKTRHTLDELEQLCLASTKAMFSTIREEIKKHDTSIGVFVSPLVHIVHDDEMETDEKWLETKEQLLNTIKK